MTDDMVSRDALRELLFDGVAPPTGADAMLERTFATEGPYGAELLPPDGLFDVPALDDPALDDVPLDDVPLDDPVFEDPALDDPAAAEPGPDHGDGAPEPGADQPDGTGPEPLDPGTGW